MAMGLRVRSTRLDQGLTQSELARMVRVPKQTIQILESRDSDLSVHSSAIADALGLHLRWLLTGKGPKFKTDGGGPADEPLDQDMMERSIASVLGATKQLKASMTSKTVASACLELYKSCELAGATPTQAMAARLLKYRVQPAKLVG